MLYVSGPSLAACLSVYVRQHGLFYLPARQQLINGFDRRREELKEVSSIATALGYYIFLPFPFSLSLFLSLFSYSYTLSPVPHSANHQPRPISLSSVKMRSTVSAGYINQGISFNSIAYPIASILSPYPLFSVPLPASSPVPLLSLLKMVRKHSTGATRPISSRGQAIN